MMAAEVCEAGAKTWSRSRSRPLVRNRCDYTRNFVFPGSCITRHTRNSRQGQPARQASLAQLQENGRNVYNREHVCVLGAQGTSVQSRGGHRNVDPPPGLLQQAAHHTHHRMLLRRFGSPRCKKSNQVISYQNVAEKPGSIQTTVRAHAWTAIDGRCRTNQRHALTETCDVGAYWLEGPGGHA